MLVTIIRIEDSIISCQLEDGHILDIDKRWLPDNIKINDEVDFNVEIAKK